MKKLGLDGIVAVHDIVSIRYGRTVNSVKPVGLLFILILCAHVSKTCKKVTKRWTKQGQFRVVAGEWHPILFCIYSTRVENSLNDVALESIGFLYYCGNIVHEIC